MNIIEIINNMFVQKAYASSLGETLNSSISNLQNGNVTSKEELVSLIAKIAIPLSVICVVLLVIYGGYMLMTSQGNPDKLQEGKQVITNAIIGFVVILLCTGILLLISNTLGLNIYG